MKIVGIVGTNADVSYNRKLLKYMQRAFNQLANIQLLEIQGLPLFNENDCQKVPEEIKGVSSIIEQSDGVIIATPEYNHSIPSALKSLLDWLSCTTHVLAKKPIMIVGASYGVQGTSRAQLHLRQILDAPGVDGVVMPSDEFLLSDCQTAFDHQGNLKDKKTKNFLASCFKDFLSFTEAVNAQNHHEDRRKNEMKRTVDEIKWDQTFDTVVLGFGGAGATAARFAADAGAKVLLTDVAPNGHEGGNTRYSAQLIGTVDDFDEGKKYYKRLTYPMNLDENMIDTFVEGMADMRNYVRKYLGVKPVSVKNDFTADDSNGIPMDSAVHEYPEYDGQKSYDFTTVHHGLFDAALWRNLRQQVMDRSDKITVWLGSPAKHLIQDANTGTIIGVQIERHHVLLNIRALNGVVMAMGGFENNQTAVQNYLGANHLAPLGTLFNKGDGVRMAQEVGADLWHMDNYEALGMLHGISVKVPEGERGRLILGWQDEANGSIMAVADDGSRYFNEAEPNRHGHVYDHGTWRVPRANVHPHLIFDSNQYEQIKANGNIPISNFFEQLVKADTLADLARIIHADSSVLTRTVNDFNAFVDAGRDYSFNRDTKTMRKFDDGPYYALELMPNVLNTQGGPRRNSRAEILDTNADPIPHLYGAGELGGICANQYQGGGNLAECLIFGKIAGENAARIKNDFVNGAESKSQSSTAQEADSITGASEHEDSSTSDSDLDNDEDLSNIELDDDQYLGISDAGMGGEVVVKITYKKNRLSDVEIIKQRETGEVGGKAVKELPAKMVDANTYDVDAVSGASVSSNAIKSAVKNALDKAKQTLKA